jgi:ketosteroid isomerase-like protein
MSESFPLPTEPEGVIPSLVERFNSGKVSAMMALYAPEAVFITNDGRTITDRAEIAARLERDIKLGLPLMAKVRHVFVAGDTAQIVVDWSIDGKVPTARTCTSEARLAISRAAARMDAGDTLSTIIKGPQCDSPPDICAPRQLSAMEPFFSLASTITNTANSVIRIVGV